jgi:hypothetical protein
MLRITILNTRVEQRFVLEGRLTEVCLPEVRNAWEQARNQRQGRECVIDLSGVTVLDADCREALGTMAAEGARLTADGVYTKYLIEKFIGQAREKRRSHAGVDQSFASQKVCDCSSGIEPEDDRKLQSPRDGRTGDSGQVQRRKS